MTIRTILLFAPAETARAETGAVPYAIALAQRFGAEVTALAFVTDVTSPKTADPADARLPVEAAAEARGVKVNVVSDHSHAHGIHEVVADHARLHDLIVAGVDRTGLISERAVVEHLLFESGRPVLVVPTDHRSFALNGAVVAWDASRAAARALADALPLIREAETTFLTVGGDKDIHCSLTEDQEQSALAARGLAPRFVRTESKGRAIDVALGDEARALGGDLLVMGAYGSSRLKEFVLGGATAGTLRAPVLPTLLSH